MTRSLLVLAFEQRAAHAVDGLALLVHDVVVFEQVFAGGEVLRFHGLLRGGDALGDELATRWARLLPCPAAASGSACARRRRCASDRLAARDRSASCRDRPGVRRVRGADCRCGGIRAARCPARASRPAATTSSCSTAVSSLKRAKTASHSARSGVPTAAVCSASGSLFCLLQMFLGEELGIAAQQNVGAAAGHVGGNRDGALAARPARR